MTRTATAAALLLLSLLSGGASAQDTTTPSGAIPSQTGAASPGNPIATPAPTQAVSGGSSVAVASVTLLNSINSNLPQTPLYQPGDGYSIPALVSIVANATNVPAVPLATTFPPGATPTHISNAPPIPAVTPRPADFPKLDVHADPESDQVKEWLSYLDLSDVPDLSVTTGSCATSPEAAKDSSRCWWTCGGCTRSTDIVDCPTKLDWGLSYDDGPSPWTPALLDYFSLKNIKSTFFVVGSRVISRPQMVIDEYMSGHQIAVHTWSHPYLTSLTNEQIVAELGWSKKVIHDTIGVTPAFFRPPYGDIDDRVRAVAAKMGLTPIIWTRANGSTFDTTDWNIPAGTATGESSLTKFNNILELATEMENGFIVLEHDLWPQSVDLALGYVLPMALNGTHNYQLKDINSCLNLPAGNAYIETSDNQTVVTQETQFTSTEYPAAMGTSLRTEPISTKAITTGTGASSSTPTNGASSGGSGSSGSGTSAAVGHAGIATGFNGLVALVSVAIGAIVLL